MTYKNVVEADEHDGWLSQNAHHAPDGLREGVAEVTRLELGQSRELGDAVPSRGLLGLRDAPVVVCLAEEEGDEDKAGAAQCREDPERHGPRLRGEHESG